MIDYKSAENAFTDLGDKIAVFEDFGEALIRNRLGYDTSLESARNAFYEKFDVVNYGRVMSNKKEEFFDQIKFIRLIERKSDGKLFGFTYAEDISLGGKAYVHANGDDYGYEWEDEDSPIAYVFLPVKPFTVTGYEVDRGEWPI